METQKDSNNQQKTHRLKSGPAVLSRGRSFLSVAPLFRRRRTMDTKTVTETSDEMRDPKEEPTKQREGLIEKWHNQNGTTSRDTQYGMNKERSNSATMLFRPFQLFSKRSRLPSHHYGHNAGVTLTGITIPAHYESASARESMRKKLTETKKLKTTKKSKQSKKKTRKASKTSEPQPQTLGESLKVTIRVEKNHNEDSMGTDSLTNSVSFEEDSEEFGNLPVPDEIFAQMDLYERPSMAWDEVVDAVVRIDNYEGRVYRNPDYLREGLQDYRLASASLRRLSREFKVPESDLKVAVRKEIDKQRGFYASFDDTESFDDLHGEWMGIGASFDNNLDAYVSAFENMLSRLQCGPKEYKQGCIA